MEEQLMQAQNPDIELYKNMSQNTLLLLKHYVLSWSQTSQITLKLKIMMEEILIPAIIFFATYHIIRILSTHLLKRKIIKSGHIDKAGILIEPTENSSEEINKYPSLKWGLVAFMGGAGLIVTELLSYGSPYLMDGRDAILPIGIELVFISLGFLIYFFIINFKKK